MYVLKARQFPQSDVVHEWEIEDKDIAENYKYMLINWNWAWAVVEEKEDK